MGLGAERAVSDRRTSESALVLSVDDPDPVFFPLVHRTAALIGSGWDRCEGLWLRHDRKGGASVGHVDSYEPGVEVSSVERDGNRTDSFLVCLNDVPEGEGGEDGLPPVACRLVG